MNKADQKQLHKDPRYKVVASAAATLQERLADLEKQRKEAVAAFDAAVAPAVTITTRDGIVDEALLFSKLRPTGDKCRYAATLYGRASEYAEAEIENVSATRVKLAGGAECDLKDGSLRGAWGGQGGQIHPDDLEKIKAGTLTGWRQKPWGTP